MIIQILKKGHSFYVPVPGFNEGTSPTFQFVEQGLPVMQTDYGWKGWVDALVWLQ